MIIRIGSTEIRNLDDLTRALKSASSPVSSKIFRGYKHYEFSVES